VNGWWLGAAGAGRNYAPAALRAVALSYALLGLLFLALAAMLVVFTWPAWSGPFLWQNLRSPGARSIASYASITIGLWILAWLSLRYVALSFVWRAVTLAASAIPALWTIVGAVKVTFTRTEPFDWLPAPAVIAVAWLFALTYTLGSYSLWKHRSGF
jgi:hypothetical protein